MQHRPPDRDLDTEQFDLVLRGWTVVPVVDVGDGTLRTSITADACRIRRYSGRGHVSWGVPSRKWPIRASSPVKQDVVAGDEP